MTEERDEGFIPTVLHGSRPPSLVFFMSPGVVALLGQSQALEACQELVTALRSEETPIRGWTPAPAAGEPDMWVTDVAVTGEFALWATRDSHQPARHSPSCPCSWCGVKHDGPQAVVTIHLPEEH
jgi:hypothetical protein